MGKKYNLVELFSGIGSQAKAMKNIDMELGYVTTCEWDIHAFVAYDAIHNSPEIPEDISKMTKSEILDKLKSLVLSCDGKTPMPFSTIKTYKEEALKKIYSGIRNSNNLVDVSSLTGEKMPDNIDVLTYSFPCQDLSNVGAFHGYNKGIDKDSGSRSSLLWQVGRILEEMQSQGKPLPRFLLMENVPTLLSNRHKKNFDAWIADLNNLGYISKYFQLNAKDFGLPQNRPRLLMISVNTSQNPELSKVVEDYFKDKTEKDIVEEYCESEFYKKYLISELLRTDYTNQILFDEACACNPNATPSRKRIWDNNPQIVLKNGIINEQFDSIRTITTKQDRDPNSGNLYFDSGIEGRSKFRYLTPRECFLFMGFTDEDYENVVYCNPEVHKGSVLNPRDKIIRMAGNSIPVKLLEGIFYQIKKIDSLIGEHDGCAQQKDSQL